jgi:hypothetical protein
MTQKSMQLTLYFFNSDEQVLNNSNSIQLNNIFELRKHGLPLRQKYQFVNSKADRVPMTQRAITTSSDERYL